MEDILIVDGYNIIGALRQETLGADGTLADARQWLVDKLADYQGYTGVKVYVVFDAHQAPGPGQEIEERNVRVIYTKEKETADERIEKLVRHLKQEGRRIVVATSDYTEQRLIFGGGALRQSARELLQELERVEKEISRNVQTHYQSKKTGRIPLTKDIAEIFEKWRRGR
jgi:hypothetical protein